MLKTLQQMFRSGPPPAPARVPAGTRYYVIGDIHGRLDLFEALIEAIERDDRTMRGAGKSVDTHVVLLGDLVDRGPDSAGVLTRTREWQRERSVQVLAGNHEDMFLAAFERPEALRHFLKHGGRETMESFGMAREEFNSLTLEELFDRMPRIVPRSVRDYIEGFEEMIIAGDYLFVHAGIDPARPLDDQKRSDMLWIRDRFLNHHGPFGKTVVHGHTISEEVVDSGNRIGIDTGAFRSGVLTALVLEGSERRVIQTRVAGDGPIAIAGVTSAG